MCNAHDCNEEKALEMAVLRALSLPIYPLTSLSWPVKLGVTMNWKNTGLTEIYCELFWDCFGIHLSVYEKTSAEKQFLPYRLIVQHSEKEVITVALGQELEGGNALKISSHLQWNFHKDV
jgi:meiotically up-regulated gene 157 (Mug157) protein